MKILGVRTSNKNVRYAILNNDSGSIIWENINNNRLLYPKDMSGIAQKIVWLSKELRRILEQTPNIDKIVIKVPEYGRIDSASNRASIYLDAVVILEATARDIVIPVDLKTYRHLNTRSSEVKDFVECHIGRCNSYWDSTIADALAAAYSEF